MIVIIATLKVQEGEGAGFEAMFLELTAKVRGNEPENLLYQLTQSQSDPTVYKVRELYTDQEAVTAHGGTEYFRELGRKIGLFMAGPPEIEHLDAVG